MNFQISLFLFLSHFAHIPAVKGLKTHMTILYHLGHPGTDRAFMEEFGQFLEILSVCREKLVICGDFNYWPDNPSLKPYTNEFMRPKLPVTHTHTTQRNWFPSLLRSFPS